MAWDFLFSYLNTLLGKRGRAAQGEDGVQQRLEFAALLGCHGQVFTVEDTFGVSGLYVLAPAFGVRPGPKRFADSR